MTSLGRCRFWRAAFIALCCGGFAETRAAGLRVVGTDLLGVDFSKALYAFAVRSDLQLALAFDGSRPGLDELKAGRADLGLFFFAPGEEEGATAFQCTTLAYQRVVILGPANLPIDHLTLDQLDGVFGVGGPLLVSTFGDLGLDGVWTNATIVPLAPAVGSGIAADFFRHTVLRDRYFKSNLSRFERAAELGSMFEGDSRAIALVAAPPLATVKAKTLGVAPRKGEPAFLPTLENIHSGDYPLRLPLAVVFRRESAKTVRPLLRFLFSDEAAPLIEKAELAPLPAAARRQQVLALEKL